MSTRLRNEKQHIIISSPHITSCQPREDRTHTHTQARKNAICSAAWCQTSPLTPAPFFNSYHTHK